MLGQRYLETRDSLADAVTTAKALALETNSSAEELTHEGVAEILASPLRIAVCGEKGSGKTSFLHALLGLELNSESEKAIHVYGAGVLWGESPSSHVEYQQVRALAEHGGLEVIDTGAVSKLTGDERERMKTLLSESDHVFWVMSSENPWAAKSWDLVTEMRELLGKRSSVILQKVDLLKKKDIEVLLGHLTSLSIQRVGHALPMHCVSAEKGIKSWGEGKRDGRLWLNSGFKDCETALDTALNSGEERREALLWISQRMLKVVNRVETTIQEKISGLRSDIRSLQLVETEVERSREHEVQNSRENVEHIANVVCDCADYSVNFAKRKNSLLATLISIFNRGDGALSIEKNLQEEVSEATYERSQEVAFGILAKCERQWSGMKDDLQKRMAVDVVSFDNSVFEEKVDIFAEKMQKKMKHAMVMLKLRRLLDRMMVTRQRALKKMVMWLLSFVSIAGIIGYADIEAISFLPWIFMGLAGVVFAVMLGYGYKTRKSLLAVYSESVYNVRYELADMIQGTYEDEIREFYSGYTSMFENLRRYIVNSEESIEPLNERWHDLFLQHRAIHQDI